MPKIKGWRKGLGQPDVIEWEHALLPISLLVVYRKTDDYYEVVLMEYRLPTRRITIDEFTIKQKAIAFALQWMRKHPRGFD